MLMIEEQPFSLADFKYRYFLEEFDGHSDIALEPTWVPKGLQRESTEGEAAASDSDKPSN